MKAASVCFAAVIMTCTSTALGSEAFRCGGHIISDGDNKVKVLEHCGQPTEKEGNKWIYDRGQEQFVVIVHFDDDVVSLIEEVPRD